MTDLLSRFVVNYYLPMDVTYIVLISRANLFASEMGWSWKSKAWPNNWNKTATINQRIVREIYLYATVEEIIGICTRMMWMCYELKNERITPVADLDIHWICVPAYLPPPEKKGIMRLSDSPRDSVKQKCNEIHCLLIPFNHRQFSTSFATTTRQWAKKNNQF